MQENSSVRQRLSVSLIFIVGLLFYCYEFYLRLITGAYEPQIIKHLAIHSHLSFSFLISSYNWTYLLMQIPAGILLDRYGSKRIIIVAILFCGLGNIVFLSPDYSVALLGRLLVGFGSAFAFVSVLKLAREYFEAKYFALLCSITISIGTLAAAFSQQLSVYVLSQGVESWQAIFIISGLIALPLGLFVWLAFSQSSVRRQVNIMPNWSVAWQQVKNLFKLRSLWLISLWGGLLYTPTVVLTAQYGMRFFQSLYHVDAVSAAGGMTAILMGWVIFSPIIGYCATRLKSPIWLIMIFIFGTILTLLGLTYGVHLLQNHMLTMAFLFGSFSAIQVLVWYFFGKVCPRQFSATGVAMINMLVTLVTELGQLGSGALLDWHKLTHWASNMTGVHVSLQVDMWLFVLLLVIASLLSVRINKHLSV